MTLIKAIITRLKIKNLWRATIKVVFHLGELLNIDVVITGFDFCAAWEIDYLAREDSMI
tara:strand:- start:26 stop:202 length:177 start_codon:yes stop_codon:yes gene_type:complete